MISFTIPMLPVAKQTKGNRVVKCHDGRSIVQRYTPLDVRRNAESLASLIAPHRPKTPLAGPVSMVLVFHFPWMQSHNAKQRDTATGCAKKPTKPDLDNLEKQILDTLQAVGFFESGDQQVSRLVAEKVYSDYGPMTEIAMEGE